MRNLINVIIILIQLVIIIAEKWKKEIKIPIQLPQSGPYAM